MFAMSAKSASKVTIVKLLALAKVQISVSEESSSSNVLTCSEFGKMEEILEIIRKEIF